MSRRPLIPPPHPRPPIVPPSIRDVEHAADGFQQMLDASRTRTDLEYPPPPDLSGPRVHPSTTVGQLEELERRMASMTDEPTVTVHSETGRLPPAENIPEKAPTPQEIAASAISSISSSAQQMAQEADAAATAIESLATQIRADADSFKSEVGKLSEIFCERVAGYMAECAAIATSFQVKKEQIIKAAQSQGPLLITAQKQ